MSILTVPEAERLDHDAATLPIEEIAVYLQRWTRPADGRFLGWAV